MTGKPRLGPEILRIESMSDGRVVVDQSPLFDDFTGEALAVVSPEADRPARVLTSAAELGRQKQIKRQDAQRQVLKVLDEVRSPRPKALFIRRV